MSGPPVRVLEALRRAGERSLSGPELSAELGVSRAQVWKHVEALRARGYRIEGDATVCFKIDTMGRVRSIRVKNYSHRIFRRPALRAIKDSSFEPLQPHEILSTARTCRTYRFRLEPIVANNES